MASPISFFKEGPMRRSIQVNKIITLTHPQSSKWKIVEILKESNYQTDAEADDPRPSFACIKLLCHEVGGNPNISQRRAMIRVYVQVPHRGTEIQDPATRARQAREYTHKELIAYKAFARNDSSVTPQLLGYTEERQDSSGLVPGGFLTWFAWSIVPGVRLGDYPGATKFWDLEADEQARIHSALPTALINMTSMGFMPADAGPRNMIWDNATGTPFWVGFRDWDEFKPVTSWDPIWLVILGLVKPGVAQRSSNLAFVEAEVVVRRRSGDGVRKPPRHLKKFAGSF